MWDHISVRGDDDCWPWLGYVIPAGYGIIQLTRGKRLRAHRVAWESVNGPIPEGMQLDHTCHNIDPDCDGGDACIHRRCCNPLHLEPVTPKANSLSGKSILANRARQTHCINGHELVGDNLYIHPQRGGRLCKTCMAATSARRSEIGVGPCIIDGCVRLAFSRGWCKPHYMHDWRYGDPVERLHEAKDRQGR